MQVGNSRVKKILMGDKVVYQDSDGWIPMELPEGVDGTAFFKDNGDGTAGLTGSVGYICSSNSTSGNYATGHDLIMAPKGYKFVDQSWTTDSNPPVSRVRIQVSWKKVPNYVSVFNGEGYVSVEEDRISFSKVFLSSPNNGESRIMFCLNINNTDINSTDSNFSDPAIIGIAKV